MLQPVPVIRLEKAEAMARLAQEAERSAAFGGCTMCRLVRGAESAPIAENHVGVVILDRYGSTEGHLLVIAKDHVEQPGSLSWEDYEQLQRLVWRATQVLEAQLQPLRVYTAALGTSEPSLPMTFPHYHVHVVPVYEAGRAARPAHVFSWSSGVVCYEAAEARAISERLRTSW